MTHDLLFIGVLIGLLYSAMTMGAGLSFRVLGVPDLTLEGGGILSAVSCWGALHLGLGPFVAVFAATVAGGFAGLLTGLIRLTVRIGPLLSGIVSAALLYSLSFKLSSGSANMSVDPALNTVFDFAGEKTLLSSLALAAIYVASAAFALVGIFRSRLGSYLRVYGDQPQLLLNLGVSPIRIEVLGLVLSNAFIGYGIGLLVSYRRVADMTVMSGVLVTVLSSLMLGEAVVRPRSTLGFVVAASLGSILSTLVLTFALFDWTDDWSRYVGVTDTRAITGLLVLVAAGVSRRLPQRRLFSSEW